VSSTASRITATVFAWLCAATSVALGAIYMFAAGAPPRYILVNTAALAVGVIAASFIRHVPLRDRRLAGASTIAIGLLLLATALFGVHIEGASRWIVLAGISLQPSLILLPLAMVHFARDRGWWSSSGLAIAGIGLGLQPDRAMAATLTAGLAALWVVRRERPVTVALAAAIAGLAVSMLSTDAVAAVSFVEQVVQSAFAFHLLTGLAIIAGLTTMLVPAGPALDARTKERAVFAVFGATWLAVIASAIIGNYPTPLVGYGSSAILGYCLSAGVLEIPGHDDSLSRSSSFDALQPGA
jgi:cell division protein FtsW (lipid II flippase)